MVSDPDVRTQATHSEVETISNVLSFVLKSLLDDVDVHKAISNLSQEPIPYFAQISKTQVEYSTLFSSDWTAFNSNSYELHNKYNRSNYSVTSYRYNYFKRTVSYNHY